MNELLPCPFCGGQAELISTDIFEPRFAMSVRCTQCHTGTMYYTYNDTDGLQDAIDVMRDLWNTRVEHVTVYPNGEHGIKVNGIAYVPERTCEIEHVKGGAMYDVWRCSACGYEYAESVSETSVVQNYCPSCGAKVVCE